MTFSSGTVSRGTSLQTKIFRNTIKGCIICGAPRHQLGRYCGTCNMRYLRTGNPYCTRVPSKKDFSKERSEAQLIVSEALRQSHEGFQWAIGFIEERFEGKEDKYPLGEIYGGYRFATPCLWLWREMGAKGWKADEALVELLAVWLYDAKNSHRHKYLPNPKHMLAIALCRLHRRGIAGTALSRRKVLGAFLYRIFKPLFENVTESYNEAIQIQRKRKLAMGQGLDLAEVPFT